MAVIDEDASASRALSRLLSGAGFAPSEFNSAEAFLADPRSPAFASLVVDHPAGHPWTLDLLGVSGQASRRLAGDGSPSNRRA